MRHLRDFNASRNAGFVAAVSDLALIILTATDGSFAHDGMSPQRTNDSSRTGSLGFWRMTGIGWVGASFSTTSFCTEIRSSRTVSVCNLSSPPNYSSELYSLDQRSHAFQAYAPVNEQINRRNRSEERRVGKE